MDTNELLMTAGRAVAVYAFMLLVIRLLGKRTVGNFSAFDLLVALMPGEVVDELIYGDVMMRQGLIAIVTLAVLHYANSWVSYRSKTLGRWLEGAPTVVVRSGRLQPEGMRHERMREDDVQSELRLQGVDDIKEVKLAMVEPDGVVSVIREDWAEPIQKKDVAALQAAAEPDYAGRS